MASPAESKSSSNRVWFIIAASDAEYIAIKSTLDSFVGQGAFESYTRNTNHIVIVRANPPAHRTHYMAVYERKTPAGELIANDDCPVYMQLKLELGKADIQIRTTPGSLYIIVPGRVGQPIVSEESPIVPLKLKIVASEAEYVAIKPALEEFTGQGVFTSHSYLPGFLTIGCARLSAKHDNAYDADFRRHEGWSEQMYQARDSIYRRLKTTLTGAGYFVALTFAIHNSGKNPRVDKMVIRYPPNDDIVSRLYRDMGMARAGSDYVGLGST